jgi:hypothetical protein
MHSYIPTIPIPHYSLGLGSCVVPRKFRYRLLSWSLGVVLNNTYDPDRVDYIAYKAHVILGTEWLFKGALQQFTAISWHFYDLVDLYFILWFMDAGCYSFIFTPVKSHLPMEQAVELFCS